MILLLLFTGYCPLFELFLIPVELELDLLDFFVDSEDTHLDIVEALLIFEDDFVELFDLCF